MKRYYHLQGISTQNQPTVEPILKDSCNIRLSELALRPDSLEPRSTAQAVLDLYYVADGIDIKAGW